VNDDRFIGRIRSELDARAEGLAPSTLGRLRAARRTALDAASRRSPRRHWLSAVAASLLVAVVSSVLWFEVQHTPEMALESLLQTASMSELQLLDEGDDLELYRDLEFYYWLEQEMPHAG
jgi:ferric-dicitrate binding protein FerR (iron transport regulator)